MRVKKWSIIALAFTEEGFQVAIAKPFVNPHFQVEGFFQGVVKKREDQVANYHPL